MIFLLLLALTAAALVDHAYATAAILGCAALFIALTSKDM